MVCDRSRRKWVWGDGSSSGFQSSSRSSRSFSNRLGGLPPAPRPLADLGLPIISLLRITYRLRKNDFLVRAKLHCFFKWSAVQVMDHRGQSCRSAKKVEVLANTSRIKRGIEFTSVR